MLISHFRPARAIGLLFAVFARKTIGTRWRGGDECRASIAVPDGRGIVVVGSRRGSGFDGKAETAQALSAYGFS